MKCLIILYCSTIVIFTDSKSGVEHSNSSIPKSQLHIEHYYSGEGERIKWKISNDSLKIKYDCDFENCKDTLIYSSSIDKTVSEEYFRRVLSMNLYKLQNGYDNFGVSDGLYEKIDFKNIYENEKVINIHATKVEEIVKLYKLTDSLILNRTKYKILKRK